MEAPSDFALPAEEMRRLGYQVVDALVEHLSTLAEKPAVRTYSRVEGEQLCGSNIPRQGKDPERVLEDFFQQVLPGIAHVNHPRFFAFIPSPGNYISALADFIASATNIFAGTWLASSGPSHIELTVLDWIRRRIGFPEEMRGLFVSGGSMANLTALAAARHHFLEGDMTGAVLYASTQTHSSIDRAIKLLGFGKQQFRKIAADAEGRIDLIELAKALSEDRGKGLRPFCVIANAGTTNTGAVDPLDALADICQQQGLWLHADGAYGAAAVWSPTGRELLKGLERVDSLSFDPHKWLFQTIECACVLVRCGESLRGAFRIRPDYLKEVERAAEEVNFCDLGIQLTRAPRALKLWLSLQVFGEEMFERAVHRAFTLCAEAAEAIKEREHFRLVSPPSLGLLAFRYEPPNISPALKEKLQGRISQDLREDGWAMLSTTVLSGETVLRLCLIHPSTTAEDLYSTLDRVERLGKYALEALLEGTNE